MPRRDFVIFGMYASRMKRMMTKIACPPHLKRLKVWLKLFVSSLNLLTKKDKFIFRNCSGKLIKATLILKIKKVKSPARTITFVKEDSYHLLFYDYLCYVCFYNPKLQEHRIYLDLQNIYEDLRNTVGDDPMPFTFYEWLNWAQPLVMVVGHCNKSPEEMEVLQNEWKVESSNKIAPYH
jgi:hypothetical protein